MDPAPFARLLADGRNADGGWGYAAGRASRLEPTCWALLAEPAADPAPLVAWPAADGLLIERHRGQPNIAFHALAIVTLLARGLDHRLGNAALVDALQRARGIRLEPSTVNRQDNSLQGWSWTAGTFSWAEPTAWGLLALERWRHAGQTVDEARVAEARAVLADRCCEDGGWNYGNANMLGRELPAYVPATAVALLALHGQTSDVVSRSLAWLERAGAREPSAVALSLAALALTCYGRPAGAVIAALGRQAPASLALGHHLSAALAVTALRAAASGHAAFC